MHSKKRELISEVNIVKNKGSIFISGGKNSLSIKFHVEGTIVITELK